jgi:hypothetical protein
MRSLLALAVCVLALALAGTANVEDQSGSDLHRGEGIRRHSRVGRRLMRAVLA